ncbi:MAG: ATP-binding protein, partial [Rubrivivax sp.]
EMITTDQPLQEILLQLVADVEAMTLNSSCSIQVLDESGQHIHRHVAHGPATALGQALEGLSIGPGQGTFGEAAATGRRCVAADTASSPAWAGLPGLAEAAGIGSSWSEPIVGKGGRVLGAFTVSHARPVQPDNLDFYITSTIALLASLAIERDRTATLLEANAAALREQQRQLQMTIDNMADGFARGRMDDSLDIVNHAVVRMLGYSSPDELLGRPSKQMYGRLEDWRQLVSALLAKGQVRDFRCQARRKDGSLLWVEVSCHLALDALGKPIGMEAVVRDITQRIAFEEALEQARNEAQAAAEARGTFLANTSHEIRTPMNAIIGLTELALRTELTPRQHDYLTKVRQAASSLLGLLNDILDFSKIESGRLDLESIPFHLDEVMGQLTSVMSLQVEEKGLELLYARAPDVPVHLVGDPLRLGQVLTNLAYNAKKFTERGDIVISTQVVARQGDRVRLRFSVQDSGIGMTPEQMERLFQPFTQADQSTTRRFGGTGLGLAISRQLVEMMGGRIWVHSEPGVGSDFQFEIELGLDQAASEQSQGTAQAAVQGLRVLVVDDNAHAQEILRLHLEHFGCRVEVCDSGADCLERMQGDDAQDPIQLVLLDYRMPEMDGLAVARRLKAGADAQRVPKVILVTAASQMAAQQTPDLIHVDEVLTKPVSPAVLLKVVSGVMSRASKSEEVRAHPRLPGAGPDARALQGLAGARVLLVEDNAINQQVATELLQQARLVVE